MIVSNAERGRPGLLFASRLSCTPANACLLSLFFSRSLSLCIAVVLQGVVDIESFAPVSLFYELTKGDRDFHLVRRAFILIHTYSCIGVRI